MTRSLIKQLSQIGSSEAYADSLASVIAYAEQTGRNYASDTFTITSGSPTIVCGTALDSDEKGNFIVVSSGTAAGIYEITDTDSTNATVTPTPSATDTVVGNKHYLKNLEDDLNYLRTQINQITGEASWYEPPATSISGLQYQIDNMPPAEGTVTVSGLLWIIVNNVTELKNAVSSGTSHIFIRNGNYNLAGEQLTLRSNMTIIGEGIPSDYANTNLDGVNIINSTNCFAAANNNRDISGNFGFDDWGYATPYTNLVGAHPRGTHRFVVDGVGQPFDENILAGAILSYEVDNDDIGTIYEYNILEQNFTAYDTEMFLKYALREKAGSGNVVRAYYNPVTNIRIENLQVSGVGNGYRPIVLNGVYGAVLKNIRITPVTGNVGIYMKSAVDVNCNRIMGGKIDIVSCRDIRITNGLFPANETGDDELWNQPTSINDSAELYMSGGDYTRIYTANVIGMYINNVNIYNTYSSLQGQAERSEFHSTTELFVDNVNYLGDLLGTTNYGLFYLSGVYDSFFNNIIFIDRTQTGFEFAVGGNNITISNCKLPNYTGPGSQVYGEGVVTNLKMYNNDWQKHFMANDINPSDTDLLTYSASTNRWVSVNRSTISGAVNFNEDDLTYVSGTDVWQSSTSLFSGGVPETLQVYYNGIKQKKDAEYYSTSTSGNYLIVDFNFETYSDDWTNVTYI